VLGVLIYVLIWVAMLPAGLGVLVLIPVLAGTSTRPTRTSSATPALPPAARRPRRKADAGTHAAAQRGWAWIIDGFALWKRNPALITFLVFGYWLCLLVVAAVPFVGQVLMSLIMPALSLGIYNGCKAVAEGRKAGPDILLSGFRQNLPELVKIGGIYLIGTFAVLGLSLLVDGGMAWPS
jgi:hypothetical protein